MSNAEQIVELVHDSRATSAGEAYEKVRDGLMWGRWKPGEKLKPQHLKEEFSTTPSVLREALIRLAGEGFVQFEEQRGFSTVRPSRASFMELRHLRAHLEIEGARLSILHGDLEWETNLTAAYHRLIYLEEKMRDSKNLEDYLKIWSRNDAHFHNTLISACRSDLLQEEYRRIYDKFRLHAVAELKTFGFRGDTTTQEHTAIVEAALARDEAACAEAIQQHVTIYRREGEKSSQMAQNA